MSGIAGSAGAPTPGSIARCSMLATDERAVDHIRQATNGGFALGSARFAQEIARAGGVERGKLGRPPRKNTDESCARRHCAIKPRSTFSSPRKLAG
jgi:hypothetical protein